MDSTLYISAGALLISICSFWLAYRSYKDNQEHTIQQNKLLFRADLHEAETNLTSAEQYFREYWRIARMHADLHPNDYDEVIMLISTQRTHLREKLNLASSIVNSTLISLDHSKLLKATSEQFSESLKRNLEDLQREIATNTLTGEERRTFLRETISRMKQWVA